MPTYPMHSQHYYPPEFQQQYPPPLYIYYCIQFLAQQQQITHPQQLQLLSTQPPLPNNFLLSMSLTQKINYLITFLTLIYNIFPPIWLHQQDCRISTYDKEKYSKKNTLVIIEQNLEEETLNHTIGDDTPIIKQTTIHLVHPFSCKYAPYLKRINLNK